MDSNSPLARTMIAQSLAAAAEHRAFFYAMHGTACGYPKSQCHMFTPKHPRSICNACVLEEGESEMPGQPRHICLGEARKMALKVLAETEKDLREERLAEARFFAELGDE